MSDIELERSEIEKAADTHKVEEADPRIGTPNQQANPAVVTPDMPERILRYDDFGLSMDPADWANKNCTTCWGQGFIKNVTTVQKKKDGGNKYIGPSTCGCATRRYMKVRLKLEDVVINIWNNKQLDDAKKTEAAIAAIKDAHKQLKTTGHVDRFDLAKVANEILEKKLVVPQSLVPGG